MESVTVVIPVGPEAYHCQYLDEAISSVWGQTVAVDEVLFIDDMHDLDHHSCADLLLPFPRWPNIWKAPWRLGVAHAFNFGVALARNECVIMLGADDVLKPTAVESCMRAYVREGARDGYYWMPVEYNNDYPDQYLPCGAAMVTKGLWRLTGGFPVESAVGASDGALVSEMLVHMPERIIQVTNDETLYGYRVHENTDTRNKGADWQGAILSVRNIVTRDWKQPTWGRYV